jgi:hypothetical protein
MGREFQVVIEGENVELRLGRKPPRGHNLAMAEISSKGNLILWLLHHNPSRDPSLKGCEGKMLEKNHLFPVSWSKEGTAQVKCPNIIAWAKETLPSRQVCLTAVASRPGCYRVLIPPGIKEVR